MSHDIVKVAELLARVPQAREGANLWSLETDRDWPPLKAAECLVSHCITRIGARVVPALRAPYDNGHIAPMTLFQSWKGLIQVSMPPRCMFYTAAGFYHTLFHELAHAAKFTLDNRLWLGGPISPAFEEVIAELTAAVVSAKLGVLDSIAPEVKGYLAPALSALTEHNMAPICHDIERRLNLLLGGY